KHSQIDNLSLIRESLWREAKLYGIGFIGFDKGGPPILAPVFHNPESAKKIFASLVKDVGESDPENRFRVSIIRGISRKHPAWYRVVFGSNLPKMSSAKRDEMRVAFNMSQVSTMEPDSTVNLDTFL